MHFSPAGNAIADAALKLSLRLSLPLPCVLRGHLLLPHIRCYCSVHQATEPMYSWGVGTHAMLLLVQLREACNEMPEKTTVAVVEQAALLHYVAVAALQSEAKHPVQFFFLATQLSIFIQLYCTRSGSQVCTQANKSIMHFVSYFCFCALLPRFS